MKNNRTTLLWVTGAMVFVAAASTATAQTNDELIQQYITNLCTGDVIISPELALVCQDANAAGAHIGNAGSVGASGTTSAGVAYLSQKASEKREKEKNKKEKKGQNGGGASADYIMGKLSVFTNLAYMDGKRDTTQRENGFDIAQYGLTAGADYRYNNKLFSGAALNVSKTENSLNNSAGSLDSNNYSLTLFGNYFPHDSLSVDGYLSAASFSYDSTRHVLFGLINEDATASYNALQLAAGTSGTYSIYIKSLTLSGVGKLDYNTTNIDAYKESGGGGLNFSYQKQSVESFTAKLGIQAGYAFSMPWGVLQPQARLHYVHEFSNNSRSVGSALVLAPEYPITLSTDEPDRNYLLGAIGASTVLPGGLQTFLDVEFLSGHTYLSTWTATAGVRWEL